MLRESDCTSWACALFVSGAYTAVCAPIIISNLRSMRRNASAADHILYGFCGGSLSTWCCNAAPLHFHVVFSIVGVSDSMQNRSICWSVDCTEAHIAAKR